LETIKDLRKSSSDNFRNFVDPSKQALGWSQRAAANALDKLLEDNLVAQARNTPLEVPSGARIRFKPQAVFAGREDLINDYKKSREIIAKSHDVEAALNDATGNVDMFYFARLLKQGRPLTGHLRDIANFASSYRKSVQMPEKVGATPGISPLDVIAGTMEAAPAMAAGKPGMAATMASGIIGRPLVRAFGLSDLWQKTGGSATRLDTAQRNRAALRRAWPAGAAAVNAGRPEVPEEED
jgi:hypothetical protein